MSKPLIFVDTALQLDLRGLDPKIFRSIDIPVSDGEIEIDLGNEAADEGSGGQDVPFERQSPPSPTPRPTKIKVVPHGTQGLVSINFPSPFISLDFVPIANASDFALWQETLAPLPPSRAGLTVFYVADSMPSLPLQVAGSLQHLPSTMGRAFVLLRLWK